MDWTQLPLLTINFLTLLLVALLSLGKTVVPGYFQEKAKNLATKQDIHDLTAKVESVKAEYAAKLEAIRANLLVDVSLKQAFQGRSLDALDEINDLLLRISRHCWSEITRRSGAEHYVWDGIEAGKKTEGLPILRCRIDDAIFKHGLYLTPGAKKSLEALQKQIGSLVGMEVTLADSNPHPLIEDSASDGYDIGLKAVSDCQTRLLEELGLVRTVNV